MKPPSTFALASAFQTPTLGPVLRDQFLLAKLRTGDEHAWRKVFPDLHQLASGVAYNIVLSIDDAQEIAMGCLAEISRPGCIGQVGIQTLERLRGYLVGIVRNKAKDFLRRKTAQRRGEGNVWNFSDLATEEGKSPVMDADSGDDLHAQVESREAQKQILEVLDTLPEKERILVKGFYLQGNTYQELADMHGIPTGTIGVYLSRALTKLRSRLQPMRA